ncbi:RNA polymerase subunit sigma-70 [Nocardia cyriacigeorgica]|nr:RNA polymerase subunit sigma-70 [Nocardia cyriacigeorgica]MBF6478678.1 RNA polymerase subunit sigma-70 [Nocardia cyriacigeorgica]MBF6550087.1 RNA polymerase subunit sigma-70 [Nocardia cyriacigeorgica]
MRGPESGWLTTVVGHICLDMLRTRTSRREGPFDQRLPEPVITRAGVDPEQEAVLADAVGLAMLIVLGTLAPAERVAFLLHDMFQMPFDEIAPIVGRTEAAARQLASRARRRVRAAPMPDPDLGRQRRVVDAFLAAARAGDLDALVATLDPDVVVRAEIGGGVVRHLRGASEIAEQAIAFASRAKNARPALVNGAAGLVAASHGQPLAVLAFTVAGGTIAELDIFADRERLSRLDPAFFGDERASGTHDQRYYG